MLRGCLDARSITDRNRSFSDHRWGITELHLWAVHEGLRGAPAATLFEDFCRRLAAAGVPLWRAFVGMRTLHPQWAGYTYTWWRDRDLVQPVRRERGEEYDQDLRDSPYLYLSMPPAHETCHCACGVDWPVAARNAIFQFSRSWRSPGRLTISPN